MLPQASVKKEQARADSIAGQFLADLREVHTRLVDALNALPLDRGTRKPAELQYTSARLKVGQASLARRVLLQRVHGYLERRASGSELAALRQLMRMDAEVFQKSTAHISHWCSARLAEDWEGYRIPAQQMRDQILALLEAERRTLFPILEQTPA